MMSKRRASAPTVDLTDGTAAVGTLVLAADKVRKTDAVANVNDMAHPPRAVFPLVRVNGRPVRLGRGVVTVRVPAGGTLVEVMDDHHYESRAITVEDGATEELWIGIGLLRSEPRIYLGSRGYANRSTQVDRGPERIGAGAAAAVGIAGLALLLPRLDAVEALPEHAPFLVVVALAVGAFWPARGIARIVAARRGPVDVGAPDPEPVAPSADPDHAVRLVPRGAILPGAGSAVCLHFGPDPKALSEIAIRYRVGRSKRKRPYFANSPVDWLAAPQITVNGHALPDRWGTWWIPVRPGTVRLRVRLPGFTGDAGELPGLNAAADLDTTVEAGEVRHIECSYNTVELAAARTAAAPGIESEWQRVLREHGRLDRAVRRARAPRLALRERAPARIASGARLPR
jgi:hypothetical protein